MNTPSVLEGLLHRSAPMNTPASVLLSIFTGFERDGWLHPDILKFLSGAGQRPRRMTILTVNQRPTTAARNFAVSEFLKSDFEWLAMLDNDNCPPVDLFNMIDTADSRFDIVTPKIYANTKRSEFTLMWARISETDSRGWCELSLAATACMMIRRSVFAKMTAPYFEFGTHAAEPLLEDEMFCLKARKAGVRIFGNRNYVARHFKTFDLSELARRYGEVDCSAPAEGKNK